MKTRFLSFLFILCVFPILPAMASSGRVWILFTDRPALTGKALLAARVQSLTPAAASRRLVRADVIWDESDEPLDSSYVRRIRAAGATVFVESRWLNGVSAVCGESCLERVRKLPFVSEIRPVAVYRRAKEPIIEDTSKSLLNAEQSTGLKYGKSKEQLEQLNVPPVHKKGFAGQGEIVAIFDSGFRKDHIAFRGHTIVAEHDFVFQDDNVGNGSGFDSHGTATWSCVNGEVPGTLFGPGFKASVILAVTEDIRSETIVEEDNWVAALEWADGLGATVVSSSLGYPDFYRPSDLNGTTAITSRAASKAFRKGIVVVSSAGNEGPGVSTLGPPADAKKILAVGAVDIRGQIAGFSSRGPTADGRLKPEVVARGVSTFIATERSNTAYGRSDGTSFSCPLVAGCVAALLSAHPEWKPVQVREAFIKTASQAAQPDNTSGYGIVDLATALDYLPKRSIVIEHKPLKDSSSTTRPFQITARIRAQRGLKSDQLFVFWKRNGDSGFQKVPLTAVSNQPDQFEGQIPAQSKGTTISYYLSAKDSKGRTGKLPFTAPSDLFSFQIR